MSQLCLTRLHQRTLAMLPMYLSMVAQATLGLSASPPAAFFMSTSVARSFSDTATGCCYAELSAESPDCPTNSRETHCAASRRQSVERFYMRRRCQAPVCAQQVSEDSQLAAFTWKVLLGILSTALPFNLHLVSQDRTSSTGVADSVQILA